MKKYLILSCLIAGIFIAGCKKSSKNSNIDHQTPANPDSITNTTPVTKTDVENYLLQSYDLLDGVYIDQAPVPYSTGIDNWLYGSVAGGEAYKGSNPTDQIEAAAVAAYTETGAGEYMEDKWHANILGITRANAALKALSLVKDGSISVSEAAQVTAEARFLRGYYELELAKLWHNVPYLDEKGTNTGNATPIWDKIEADFAAAQSALPAIQGLKGRPNKYAAEAFLVKTYLFDHKYPLAQPLLADLIANGVTTSGMKYTLGHYADNFNPSTKYGPEGVFVVPAVVNDGTKGQNGNSGDILNFPAGGPATCCSFFSPSISFVNAFKTDAVTGLPLLDTYNNSDLKNDMGISAFSSFIPATATVDARLDWTVGRRGIPYLDWGNMPGDSWARDQPDGGPYVPIKTAYYQAQQNSTSEAYGGWAPGQATSNGYNAIRFADVLLWAAEVEVEIGNLQKAEDYVNMVRARAADPVGWVHTYQDPAHPMGGYTVVPAANYKVGLYGAAGGHTETGFSAGGQAYARKAVYLERMLELGMEGHRFFDLQRWDSRFGGPAGADFMAQTIQAYLTHEKNIPNFPSPLIKTANFIPAKNELYPIPQAELDKQSNLVQNPGY